MVLRGWTRFKLIASTAALTSLFWVLLAAFWVFQDPARLTGAGAARKPAGQSAGLVPWPDRDKAARQIAPRPQSEPRPVASRLSAVLPVRVGVLAIPVIGVAPAELVDTYTQERESGERQHDAIDIMAPAGTPVVAAAPGKVEKLYLSDAGGKTVYVRSDDGRRIYYYAHLDDYAPGLFEGERVRSGTRLGSVGATGNADPAAPHLHFEVQLTRPDRPWHQAAVAINPYPLLAGKGRPR